LPVVTVLNSWTLPQERFNPSWITELGLGITGSSFKRLREPVAQLLANLQDYSARVRAMPANRAVHEIVELIERLLEEPVSAQACSAPSLLPQANSRVSAATGGTVV
jgi:hypothetical protein